MQALKTIKKYKKENNMSVLNGTPHNSAKKGEIADIVLMPGDPLRAKLIAETYLEDAVCYNTVRNVLGYTGTYKGVRISVQASGMGIPSMGIYSYELFNHYDVKKIIRVGSAGAISEDLNLGDIAIASNLCTDSNYVAQFELPGQYIPPADFQMVCDVLDSAKNQGIKTHVGTVFTSDIFYNEDQNILSKWQKMGVLCVEMESVALYANAVRAGKEAVALFTISDLPIKGISMEADERRTSFTQMIEVALEAAIK